MKRIKQNIPFYLILLLLGIAFYALDCWNVFNSDDYAYSCVIDEEGKAQERISNINQVFLSLHNHFYILNGRLIIHFFVIMFCSIWGVGLFRICNSIIFSLFLYFLFKLTNPPHNYISIKLLIYVLFIFSISPIFSVFLGTIAFSLNYLWASTAILLFTILYEKNIKQSPTSKIKYIALFCVGIITGALHEGFSVGMMGAIVLYSIFYIKKLNKNLLFLFAGFIIGTILIILAPANFSRMKDTPTSAIFSALCRMIFQARVFYALLLINAISFFTNKYRFKQFVVKNILYYLAAAISTLFVIIIAKRGDLRAIYGAEFYALILVIKELNYYIDLFYQKHKKFIPYLYAICCIAILGGFSYAYNLRKDLYKSHAEMIDNYLKSEDGTAYVSNELSKNTESRFATTAVEYVILDCWANGIIDHYYQHVPIITLPEEIKDSANFFINKNRSRENPLLYTTPTMCFYVLNLKNIPDITPESKIILQEEPHNTIVMKILSKLHKHPYTERKTSNNYDYLIIQKHPLYNFDKIDILIDGKPYDYFKIDSNE